MPVDGERDNDEDETRTASGAGDEQYDVLAGVHGDGESKVQFPPGQSESLFQFSTMFLRRYATLNRYSRIITQPKDQGASQAMLYATEGIEADSDLSKPMVGVASVW